jgi:diadenylate cyclase
VEAAVKESLLGAFRWRDAVDVVLVSIVVYRVLLIFRGTRAVQMLVGVGFLIATAVVARKLELATLGWMFDNFWSFWVIALVVLFQPEFRRALTRIGQGRILQSLVGASVRERARVADELAQAVEALAERKTGALIVLERATGLRHYADLGVPLDALVSADLLVCVFQPPSPLHDGAVLVQGPRLVAAGCFLPLSRNVHLGRALGTRHRAALGITEETDAVAVVVSEETGRVSVAVEGEITPAGDTDALRHRLAAFLGGAPAAAVEPVLRRGVRRLLPRAPDPL